MRAKNALITTFSLLLLFGSGLAANLITNGGFENNAGSGYYPYNWTCQRGTCPVYDINDAYQYGNVINGSFSVALNSFAYNNGAIFVQNDIAISGENVPYYLAVYLNTTDLDGGVGLYIKVYNSTMEMRAAFDKDNGAEVGNYTNISQDLVNLYTNSFVVANESLYSISLEEAGPQWVANTIQVDNVFFGQEGESYTPPAEPVIEGTGYFNSSNWHILGWLNNIEDFAGYYQSASHGLFTSQNCYWDYSGKDACIFACSLAIHQGCSIGPQNSAQIKTQCGTYTCDVTEITYALSGSTVIKTVTSPLGSGYDNYAVPSKYYDGINNYFYVLGQPFTEEIRASLHILPYMRLQASASGCHYINPDVWYSIFAGSTLPISYFESAIPTTSNNDYWGGDYWTHDNSGDYVVSETGGFICDSQNNVTIFYDFYNTQTSELLFTKNVTVPIGYVTAFTGTGIGSTFEVDYNQPFDCIFNASLCINSSVVPLTNITCVGIGCNPIDDQNLLSAFNGLDALFTPLTILSIVVIIGAILVIQRTKSTQLGLITVMMGVLILSFYGVLPWWIAVLISIGCAFFLLSAVRQGVIGNGSP